MCSWAATPQPSQQSSQQPLQSPLRIPVSLAKSPAHTHPQVGTKPLIDPLVASGLSYSSAPDTLDCQALDLCLKMVATVQHKAPAFSAQALVDGAFKEVHLDQYKVTFVCPTEIIAFSDRIEEFKKIGAEVVAASVDSHFSHLAWTKQPRSEGGLGEMKIPILADITKTISRDYGVLVEDGPDAGVALRGTFIIDPKQNVRAIQINDLPIGRSVDEILRLLDALQFHEKHGDVCPVGWKKGAQSMKADPVGSIAYFEKTHSAGDAKRKSDTAAATNGDLASHATKKLNQS
ncbi:hypothetical protein BASA81_017442 [Batrachochytrium salamandrivorans]|nr:hypothetical protein BASA81_017442 [Batrachochytrium salamandrivorans]